MTRLGLRCAAGTLAVVALGGCTAPTAGPRPAGVTPPVTSESTSAGSAAPTVTGSGSATTATPGGPATGSAPGGLQPSATLPSPEPLAAGQQFVTAPSHGVRFGVPSGWQPFDLKLFSDPAVRAALVPVAQKLGVTVDAYVHQLTTANDLIVTGPDAAGVTPTLSVRKEAAGRSDRLPTDAEASEQVKPVAGTVTGVRRTSTPLGTGYAVAYTRPGDSAGQVVYCASLGLPAPDSTMFLAVVEAGSAADRDALVHLVTSTLQTV